MTLGNMRELGGEEIRVAELQHDGAICYRQVDSLCLERRVECKDAFAFICK